MKKILAIILLSSLILSGCDSIENTSFKEYTEIVKSANEGQKDIFIFTASSCGTCQEVFPFIEKYMKEVEDISIYILSVDSVKDSSSSLYRFKDKTMGYLSGVSSNDCLKALDNRIIEFVTNQNDYSNYLSVMPSGNYTYMSTPLAILYEGGIEIKITNIFSSVISAEGKENKYNELKKILQYPTEKANWDKPFDIDYYKG